MPPHIIESQEETRHTRQAADNAKTRRERGKLAQRAFRQRQIDTIGDLREENKRLRDAIVSICRAAAADETTLGLAIRDARKVAHIEDGEEALGALAQPSEDHEARHSDLLAGGPHGFDFFDPYQAQPQRHNLPNMGNISSFDADCYLNITSAPEDIAPFLGSAAYSVAGQIHWVTLAYSYSVIKALRTATPSSDACRFASRIFGRVLRQISLEGLLAILHARLVYRKEGLLTGNDHPARDPRLAKALMLSIVDLCAPEPKRCFLSAFDVADRLRDELGAEFPVFEAVLCGKVTDYRSAIMRDIMRELASKAICYGDGPRWNPHDVVSVSRRWFSESNVLNQWI
ncbi:hypothetical protein SCAR479_01345 [Seiridium cardinale]|uniref:BZIP domain-containing protein n=1 Tax=Seiridium cardinale TaxID=138064 RepID=A0ABR2Y607_9PEZI